MEEAKKGNITPEMEKFVKRKISTKEIITKVAEGKIVIPKNINRNTEACGIGEGLSTKINANIGSSSKIENIKLETHKAKLCMEYGADALMDLSTGPDLELFRKQIMETVNIPIGTVPIYEAESLLLTKETKLLIWKKMIFLNNEKQAKEGVDFMTLHCGITQDLVKN